MKKDFNDKPQEVVLGAVLMKAPLLRTLKIILSIDDFEGPYKEIYQAMVKLDSDGEHIDIITVTAKVINKDISPSFVASLTNAIGSPELVDGKPLMSWCMVIKETAMKRQLKDLLIKVNDSVDNYDIFEVIQKLRMRISELTPTLDHGVRNIDKGIQILEERIIRNEKGISPMITGIEAVDDFTLGYQKGDLIVVCGETSQGKTAFALTTMYNACMSGKRVAMYSYEMTTAQMMARIVAMDSEVSSKRILMQRLNDREIGLINKSYGRLEGKEFYFVEPRKKTLAWLEDSIESVVTNYNVDMVIVDYLQLIRGEGFSKADQIGGVANSLKHFATRTEIDVPIMLLSQLSRNSNNPQPQLWRLKESGDIENAADTVMGIWRPDHYGLGDPEFMGVRNWDHRPVEDVGIVEIMKGRNIGTARIAMKWSKTQTLYSNL